MGRAVEKSFERLDILTVEHQRGSEHRSFQGKIRKKNSGSGEVRTRAGFPHWESSKLKSSALDHSATLPIPDHSYSSCYHDAVIRICQLPCLRWLLPVLDPLVNALGRRNTTPQGRRARICGRTACNRIQHQHHNTLRLRAPNSRRALFFGRASFSAYSRRLT